MAKPEHLPIYAKEVAELPLPTENDNQLQNTGYAKGDFLEHNDLNAYFQNIYLWLKWLAPIGISNEKIDTAFYSYFGVVDTFPFTSKTVGATVSIVNSDGEEIVLTYDGDFTSEQAIFEVNHAYYNTTTENLIIQILDSDGNPTKGTLLEVGASPVLNSVINKKLNSAIDFLRSEVNAKAFTDYANTDVNNYDEIEFPNLNQKLDRKIVEAAKTNVQWISDNPINSIESKAKFVNPDYDWDAIGCMKVGDIDNPIIKKALDTRTFALKESGGSVRESGNGGTYFGDVYFNRVGNAVTIYIPKGFYQISAAPNNGDYLEIDVTFTVPEPFRPYKIFTFDDTKKTYIGGILEIEGIALDDQINTEEPRVYTCIWRYNHANNKFTLLIKKPFIFYANNRGQINNLSNRLQNTSGATVADNTDIFNTEIRQFCTTYLHSQTITYIADVYTGNYYKSKKFNERFDE